MRLRAQGGARSASGGAKGPDGPARRLRDKSSEARAPRRLRRQCSFVRLRAQGGARSASGGAKGPDGPARRLRDKSNDRNQHHQRQSRTSGRRAPDLRNGLRGTLGR
ncbi:hypothetical protein MCP1_90063 [Candidatus Terasakiella magnetica]|nr:hypothetical protein MCP1_90063 [Candidatus Terasakiella magnetica]